MTVLLQQNGSLQPFHTFGTEARATWMTVAESVHDLRALRQDARVRDLPWMILGGGSNVLFVSDFDGLVIRMAARGIEEVAGESDAWYQRVGAGENWPDLVARLLRSGRPGLENLAGIPGTVGAAPIQNIGAYGVELAERLHSVTVWDGSRDVLHELSAEDCGFGYRDSVFKQANGLSFASATASAIPGTEPEPETEAEAEAGPEGAGAKSASVVVAVTLRLPRHWQPVVGYAELARELRERGAIAPGPQEVCDAVLAIRGRKLPDPAVLGNAGSFFKNPIVSREVHADLLAQMPSLVSYPLAGGRYKLAAGWLIDACGLKGITRGRAGIFEKQALVLVNRGGATGREIWELALEVQDQVRERFGVTIEPEPRIVGA